jgi:hypothetical protein
VQYSKENPGGAIARVQDTSEGNLGVSTPFDAPSQVREHKLDVTFFWDEAAQRKRGDSLTLPELCGLIRGTTAPSKGELPFVKLARFGDKRSPKNSLRHNANVLEVTGCELDYDAGQVSFEEAIETARQHRLLCLIYTSASYTAEKPKWRIVCPASQAAEPGERAKWVARVNGLFGGIFAPESFVLSQSYFFGHVNTPEHRAVIVDGDFIDLREDLDAGAIGRGEKPQQDDNPFLRVAREQQSGIGFEGHLAQMGDGPGREGFNFPINKAVGAYVAEHGRDIDREALKELLRDAIKKAPTKPERTEAEIQRYLGDNYLDCSIAGAVKKYGHTESAANKDAKQAPPFTITAAPYTFPDEASIPQYDWLLGRHLLRGDVSGTAATGGTGKSSLAIVEALAMASGKQLTHDTVPSEPLRVVLVNLEDKRNTMDKRIAAAMRHHGLTKEDIGDRLIVLAKEDKKFKVARQRNGDVKRNQELIDALVRLMTEHRGDVISIDSFIRTHAVNENDNAAIEKVVECFEEIAERANCAVHLWHHTRKSGGLGASVESARGAQAFIDACRSVRILETMTAEEAKKLKIANRRPYFRAFNGKLNFALATDASQWLTTTSVTINNGPALQGMHLRGDEVGVAERWEHPGTSEADLSDANVAAIKELVGVGKWRDNVRAEMWVGKAVAQVLNLDPEADVALVKATLRRLFEIDALKRKPGQDRYRRETIFVVPCGSPAAVDRG